MLGRQDYYRNCVCPNTTKFIQNYFACLLQTFCWSVGTLVKRFFEEILGFPDPSMSCEECTLIRDNIVFILIFFIVEFVIISVRIRVGYQFLSLKGSC